MTQPYQIQQATVKNLEERLANTQAKLTAGTGIQISDTNVISATSSADVPSISTQEQAYAGKDDTTIMTPLKVASVAGRVTQLGFDGVLENKVITFTHSTSYAINDGYEYEFDLLFPVSGVLDDNYQMVIVNNGNTYVLSNALDPSYNPMTVANMKQVQSYDPEVGFKWSFKAVAKTSSTGIKLLYIVPSIAMVTKDSLGLDKVDNTSDMDKPISTLTQAALDTKADKSTVNTLEDSLTMATSDIEGLETTTQSLTTQVDTLNQAIVNKANTVDVVTLADSQNITGAKCFINNASSVASDAHAGMSLTLKNNEASIGEKNDKYYYQGIRVVDKNNEEVGSYYVAPDGQGGTATYLMASTKVNGEYKDTSLTLGIDKNGNPYNAIVTPAKGDNSARIATTKYVKDNLEDYATKDSIPTNVVHTSGNEVIDGIKTFSNVVNLSEYGTRTKSSAIKGTAPTTSKTFFINTVYDSEGLAQANKMFQTFSLQSTSNEVSYSFMVFKPEHGSTAAISLRVGYNTSGEPFASAPTYSDVNDNSDNLVTTKYLNNKFKVVSTLPTTQQNGVFYFVTGG